VLGQQFSTPGGNMNSIGMGSQVQAVRAQFSQGGVQTSNNPLDVAIQGSGMLVLNDNGTRLYTRAGNMHLDSNGNLVSGGGANVQGYQLDPTTGLINKSGGVSDIVVPNNLVSPTATTQFDLGMNLDASAATGSTFSTTVQIFDSNGTSHNATLSMVKDITGGATPVTRWRFRFDDSRERSCRRLPTAHGQLSLLTGPLPRNTGCRRAGFRWKWSSDVCVSWGGSRNQSLPRKPDGSSRHGHVASTWKRRNLVAHDLESGFRSGTPNVSGLQARALSRRAARTVGRRNTVEPVHSVQRNLSRVFNNGRTVDIAQLVLAQFSDFNGLTPQGNGLFTESSRSGTAESELPKTPVRGN
jgi:flagellar hook protein FlgE